jgi:AT-binding transcription factor 1
MQIINKKCPYCSAIFKVKSALESHLQTKHPDKTMVNVDSIPEIKGNYKAGPVGFQIEDGGKLADNQVDMMNLNLLTGQNPNELWKSGLMPPMQKYPFYNKQMILPQPQRKTGNDFSESEISLDSNDEIMDDDYDMDYYNDEDNEDMSTVGNVQATQETQQTGNTKRHRTHMTVQQKKILRKLFDDVKTPTMVDCENVGKEIGLSKRVVQVIRFNLYESISTLGLPNFYDINFITFSSDRFGSRTHELKIKSNTKTSQTTQKVLYKTI